MNISFFGLSHLGLNYLSASRIQQRIALKKSTQNDFRARLKSRFDRFKSRIQNEPERNIGRGSVSQISLDRTSFGRSAFRSSRERSRSREQINSKESRSSREQIHSKEDRSGEALGKNKKYMR